MFLVIRCYRLDYDSGPRAVSRFREEEIMDLREGNNAQICYEFQSLMHQFIRQELSKLPDIVTRQEVLRVVDECKPQRLESNLEYKERIRRRRLQ